MSTAETWKTTGLQILHTHDEECGDGSCGCGCGDIPLVTPKAVEKVGGSEEVLQPVRGPETCG